MKLIDIRNQMPRHPSRKWKTRDSADTIVIHTTAGSNQNPKVTAKYHITPGKQNHLSEKGAPGLAYHDFITKEGIVYHCNSYTDSTWHCKLWNKRSIGVVMAFMGQTGESPVQKQYDAMIKHISKLCLYIKILPKRVFGHREAPWMSHVLGNGSIKFKKSCPGWGVDMDEVRNEVTKALQIRLSEENLYHGEIDGLFGLKSIEALKSFDPSEVKGWRFTLK